MTELKDVYNEASVESSASPDIPEGIVLPEEAVKLAERFVTLGKPEYLKPVLKLTSLGDQEKLGFLARAYDNEAMEMQSLGRLFTRNEPTERDANNWLQQAHSARLQAAYCRAFQLMIIEKKVDGITARDIRRRLGEEV